jgi:hypothetical protein
MLKVIDDSELYARSEESVVKAFGLGPEDMRGCDARLTKRVFSRCPSLVTMPSSSSEPLQNKKSRLSRATSVPNTSLAALMDRGLKTSDRVSSAAVGSKARSMLANPDTQMVSLSLSLSLLKVLE